MKLFKNMFKMPSAEAIAINELEHAKRSLLEAYSGLEFAESAVKYHEARIRRLTVYLSKIADAKE